MIHLLGKIPPKVIVACSGGVDSMAVVDFLKRGHDVELAFFHHGTENSENAEYFLKKYCSDNGLKLHLGRISDSVGDRESPEEFWRRERYLFFDNFNATVIACHHLDDVLETWIFSSAHGNPKVIPYERNRVIRPFLLNRKCVLEHWAASRAVPFVNDKSNEDLRYMRNYVRHKVVPAYVGINKGVYKVMRRKVLANLERGTAEKNTE